MDTTNELLNTCEIIIANKIDRMEAKNYSEAHQILELMRFRDEELDYQSINPAAKCIFAHLIKLELFRLSN